MAIKGQRDTQATEIGFYLNEAAAQGAVVSLSTASSGSTLDATTNLGTISASSSGQKPIGVLLTETVDIDPTRQPVNWHKDQALKGDKVNLQTKGWLVTNLVVSATAGQAAVLASSGYVMDQPAIATWNRALNPLVGKFLSTVDEGGYARLSVDL